MKIAIEATGLMGAERGGIASYTLNLVDALLKRSDVDLALYYKLSRFRLRHYRYRPEGVQSHWYHRLAPPTGTAFDIAHSCDSHFLNMRRAHKVVTVHDVAVLKPEFQFAEFSSLEFAAHARRRLREFINSAQAIIAVSQCTKDDLLELFDYPEDRVHVVHLGHSESSIMNSLVVHAPQSVVSTQRPYLLFVGAISVRKNLVNLVKAYAASGLRTEFDLVLAGTMGMGSDTIMREINRLGISANVITPGYIPDDELSSLYQGASAFLFPTYYEGFGIPIVDAMYSSVPVLIGNRGAAVEIAGEHAVAVDPFSVDDIAQGIHRVIEMDRVSIVAAKEHASRFTWERTAQQTMEAYQRTIDSR